MADWQGERRPLSSFQPQPAWACGTTGWSEPASPQRAAAERGTRTVAVSTESSSPALSPSAVQLSESGSARRGRLLPRRGRSRHASATPTKPAAPVECGALPPRRVDVAQLTHRLYEEYPKQQRCQQRQLLRKYCARANFLRAKRMTSVQITESAARMYTEELQRRKEHLDELTSTLRAQPPSRRLSKHRQDAATQRLARPQSRNFEADNKRAIEKLFANEPEKRERYLLPQPDRIPKWRVDAATARLSGCLARHKRDKAQPRHGPQPLRF
eukprot:TRINITY_DN21087_c0_g1_i1.p1 TRINITY_DN21087_c0_g1~~TRINITY_DN21087_c0_g1_i1.p1  ORF type:complete len:271 (+),score=25.67 TRINITY_DN21087_c0_g1_i1:69-881(+)